MTLDDRVLLVRGTGLSLVSAVGLDHDPYELSVFELALASADVHFGRCGAATASDTRQLHSLASSSALPPSLVSLLAPSQLGGRGWGGGDKAKSDVLRLGARILFDGESNLKTIALAFKFSEAGVRLQSLVREPEWVDWLARFFTVVEYPVDGYVPPAIMTHMQFELCNCSIDIIPTCHATR